MLQLNLPAYNFRFQKSGQKLKIYDMVRRAYVALTPEEWVRQHFIMFLINEKKVPASHIMIEKSIKQHNLLKRFDALVVNNKMEPAIILEFKAPDVKLSEDVFEQINIYNLAVDAYYLIISNGLQHFAYVYNKNEENYKKININDLPLYTEL